MILDGFPDFSAPGRCAEVDPELFFPDKGGSSRAAKKICGGCEVRLECLEFALKTKDAFGVWGGLSDQERRRLQRRRPGPALQPIPHGTESGYRTHRRRGQDACERYLRANTLAARRRRDAAA